MRRLLRLPARIGSQIALLVVGVIALLYLIIGITIYLTAPRDRPGPPVLEAVAATVRIVAHAPPEVRAGIIAAANAAELRFRLAPVSGAADPPPGGRQHPSARFLAQRLGPGPALSALPSEQAGEPPRRFRVDFSDGSGLAVEIAPGVLASPPRPISLLLLATIVLIGLNVGAFSIWASKGIAAPLARFASAAEEFSIDRDPAPLREEGPTEIRTAARALNRLRDRIHAMFADRTRMLAAISHDLRTPITRMRLRVEFIEDHGLRGQFTRDLAHMDAMVQGALSYLRDGNQDGEKVAIDLSSLLQTLTDEFAETGHAVRYEGPRQAVAIADAQHLGRALTNLLDNAVRYGQEVAVRLRDEGTSLVIEVADDGPGISHDDRQRLLEPFVRGDEARGRIDNEGFGLGLSIAQAIATAHGGSLTLHDNEPRGLLVRIILPGHAAGSDARGG